MIFLQDDFNDMSFKNLVLHYREELLDINKTGHYSDSLLLYNRHNLRKHGVLNVRKGGSTDQVYLTEKALQILECTRTK